MKRLEIYLAYRDAAAILAQCYRMVWHSASKPPKFEEMAARNILASAWDRVTEAAVKA
ncbi:MAG: hypothetical protein JSS87_12780 [Acidobacteria bacterium]|nr:hypothetical protein [Acidobacteriota bacterium]